MEAVFALRAAPRGGFCATQHGRGNPRACQAVCYRDRPCVMRLSASSMSSVNAPEGHAKPIATKRAGPTYSISELAQEFALTTRAIRFYEHEGLLAPRRRGLARIYGERERTRIKLILRGKRLGLALSEIRELFDIYATAGNERP